MNAAPSLPLNIAFYAPFKPLDHPHPSGDRAIASSLFNYLEGRGHRLYIADRLRTRWIFRQPWRWPHLMIARQRVVRRCTGKRTDLWLTYHSYYKAPDLLGPVAARKGGLPYVIFQASYATKYRRRPGTVLGFHLNRRALLAADHIFVNRHSDLKNLRRLLPDERLTYVAPGIFPDQFTFHAQSRRELRGRWRADGLPVVMTAAMFRADVKTQGLLLVIEALALLRRRGRRFLLVIAGDGPERGRLQAAARARIPGQCRFLGRIAREEMYRYYSAVDLFAFPGINESLGMVFLEAQACHLPVVAFDNGGIPEIVRDGRTGFLTPLFNLDAFADAIDQLITNPALCRNLGETAGRHVRCHHDLDVNYARMHAKLVRITAGGMKTNAPR
ncbi:glycosyltransferase family 4 protein [Desulfosarcina ovata]|uniref:Glycosyl transferase n=1 Tax=Desulfosarcina ovata subsp. ovata TaxID=2752305 RepID=A0A5K8ALE0_9BACT|nr:glycosyltransferase family 4 protein [Desulfosarcina ovata]BBO93448.1 glycosyl transferase [Desulfosarcina ovata subsp. ovata]